MKMVKSYPNGYKTQWEKEKFLIMRNFSFSHSVFKRLVLQTRKNQGLFGKGLNNDVYYKIYLSKGIKKLECYIQLKCAYLESKLQLGFFEFKSHINIHINHMKC